MNSTDVEHSFERVSVGIASGGSFLVSLHHAPPPPHLGQLLKPPAPPTKHASGCDEYEVPSIVDVVVVVVIVVMVVVVVVVVVVFVVHSCVHVFGEGEGAKRC